MASNKYYSLLIALSSTLASCSMSNLSVKPDIDRYVEIPISFEHQWDGVTHPFTGVAVIDVDGDKKMEIFIGGGEGQEDQLLSYQDNTFTNIIKGKGLSSLSATHGATSLDMDNDGDVDLPRLHRRESGVGAHSVGPWSSTTEVCMEAVEAAPRSVRCYHGAGLGEHRRLPTGRGARIPDPRPTRRGDVVH